jgi:hypothetical protein
MIAVAPSARVAKSVSKSAAVAYMDVAICVRTVVTAKNALAATQLFTPAVNILTTTAVIAVSVMIAAAVARVTKTAIAVTVLTHCVR